MLYDSGRFLNRFASIRDSLFVVSVCIHPNRSDFSDSPEISRDRMVGHSKWATARPERQRKGGSSPPMVKRKNPLRLGAVVARVRTDTSRLRKNVFKG